MATRRCSARNGQRSLTRSSSPQRRAGLALGAHSSTKRLAGRRSAARLELRVYETNAGAIAFYERLGMETLSRTMNLPLDE